MSVVLITGSGGLIGSKAAMYFHELGFMIIGIDNNMRKIFFGEEASTNWVVEMLQKECPNYIHYEEDIRNNNAMKQIFLRYQKDIKLIIHTAAQPSHDWAAKDPFTDFTTNAIGTLNLLENTRKYTPDAAFIFTSSNRVYGDTPNHLPLVELETRWEIEEGHEYINGIPETMSIDQSKHSLFGASKVAADILVQEYGRYFGIKSGIFRGGCFTGPNHSGAMLHGFLAYLMKCVVIERPYTVFGYKGKQVRDNIHSHDLINAFYFFYQSPRIAEVYNIGGGRYSNCSILEAIKLSEKIAGKELNWNYSDNNRIGDHIWWIGDIQKFKNHYPEWNLHYNTENILLEIYEANKERWKYSAR